MKRAIEGDRTRRRSMSAVNAKLIKGGRSIAPVAVTPRLAQINRSDRSRLEVPYEESGEPISG